MQQIYRPYDGLFITIEGGEGTGKSTLCEKLEQELTKKGYDVLVTREPGGVPFSEFIRDLVLNPTPKFDIKERTELFLFVAARVQHVEEKILPALRHGKLVICDRFSDSTIAYQGCARHLGMRYVEDVCRLSLESLIEPDCTILLDLDSSVGMQRIANLRKLPLDKLEKEKLQFHCDVRQGFLHLADRFPNRIVIVDAEPMPDVVLKCAINALEPRLLLKPTH